jgi:hypothetical protein
VVVLTGCGSKHDANVVSGQRGDTNAAELDVDSGATSITLSTADLGSDLYRASTPKGSGIAPAVTHANGHVRVSTTSNGNGPTDLTVQLAKDVTWGIEVEGGASNLTGDFRAGGVVGVDVNAGDARARFDLAPPIGTLGMRLTGGASSVVVHLHGSAPIRVELDGGAAHATIDGTTHTGAAAGTVFEPQTWPSDASRYELVLTAGVSSLVIDRVN